MPRSGPLRTISNFDEMAGGSSSSPSYERSVGSDNIATGQNASSQSPTTAMQIAGQRPGRRSVTITNVTGTQPVFLGPAGVTVNNGLFLAGTVGASVTIATTAAVFATAPTAAQTLSYVEVF